MTSYLNDQSTDSPKLNIYLNLDNLTELPATSNWNEDTEQSPWKKLQADGFEGVQLTNREPVPDTLGLPYCGLDRINAPAESDEVFALHRDRGDICISLHLGWGMESELEVMRLVESVLQASSKYALPAFVETHRATITQDIWRTVQITKSFPEIRFNADYSHYYCGQELVYGNFHDKLDFMEPIFSRTGFMHGRIASPGCMQMPIESTDTKPVMAVGDVDYLAHFKEMWKRAMKGFVEQAGNGDILIFAPELLRSTIYYARVFPDNNQQLVEESDRYAQALLYAKIARDIFSQSSH